jgi:type IV secretory pathway protease TraF
MECAGKVSFDDIARRPDSLIVALPPPFKFAGATTPRGGRWHLQTTYRMLKRLEALDEQEVA